MCCAEATTTHVLSAACEAIHSQLTRGVSQSTVFLLLLPWSTLVYAAPHLTTALQASMVASIKADMAGRQSTAAPVCP